MKKIIKNLIYDTDTARLIGIKSHGVQRGDADYWTEALYQKKTGEFFIHGEGGAQTRYAKNLGGQSWGWGEAITPISFDTARTWAEANLTPEVFRAAFKIPEAANSKPLERIGFRLPAPLLAKIKLNAAAAGQSIQDYLTDLIEKAFK